MKNSFNRISDRQRLFCKYVAEGDNPSFAAIKAGYSEKGNRSRACRLMKKDEIRAEIIMLQDEIASPRIASVLERKRRLSDIIRAKITDYFEVVDGQIQWIEGADKTMANSLFGIKTETKTAKSGNIISQVMSVKLDSPIRAIKELNKMEGLYRQHPRNEQVQVESQPRKVIITVASQEELSKGH
ncbi:terminase small subunit [Chloroflexota bacterium]